MDTTERQLWLNLARRMDEAAAVCDLRKAEATASRLRSDANFVRAFANSPEPVASRKAGDDD